MQLTFNINLATQYTSQSQIARVLTEDWVQNQIFCPNCGNNILKHPNNNPVGDFYCPNCYENYELKSKKNFIGKKIVDGAYETVMEKLIRSTNPSFFFLSYSPDYIVNNFIVVPKHFFVSEIVEKRKPLSQNARRAGWIGCNILLSKIPESGKIFYIKNNQIQEKKDILNTWQKTLFLRESKEIELKGWLLDIIRCIDSLKKETFTLEEIYSFEGILSKKHADNYHIRDKIRQQLQILRDRGYINFISRGVYRLT